jgi:hypothetical protein
MQSVPRRYAMRLRLCPAAHGLKPMATIIWTLRVPGNSLSQRILVLRLYHTRLFSAWRFASVVAKLRCAA